jgi:DNA-binding transcriptional MerR regulator
MHETSYTVGGLARLTHVSVRTLHHYDAVGLLTPRRRSAAGYRLYGRSDVERLHQILVYRELGFGLDDIRRVLADPALRRGSALRAQRELLRARRRRADELLEAIETAIRAEERGVTMSDEELFEVFGDFDPAEYAEEAEQRWGGTEAYEQSRRRTAAYTKDDWAAIRREEEEITAAAAELMDRAPADPAVQALIERKWRHIDERFYDCTPEVFAGLGDLYAGDPRFAKNYDKVRPGLAAFLRDAMAIYAAERED